MEASTLRWILVIVGLLVIALVWVFGNPNKKSKPKASRRSAGKSNAGSKERREPTLDGGSQESEPDGSGDAPAGQGELDIGGAGSAVRVEPESQSRPRPKPRKPMGPPPDKIITLFLLARDNHAINGAELLQAAVSTGMEFGDMDIFHRLPEGSEKPVFSMANAAKPGHFNRDEWNTFETTGVALFMTLPGPVQALDGWDAMLATARRMGEILNADLLDDERNPFTRQREAQTREEMREYDRSKQPAG
jgi:cell division protein ZipA